MWEMFCALIRCVSHILLGAVLMCVGLDGALFIFFFEGKKFIWLFSGLIFVNNENITVNLTIEFSELYVIETIKKKKTFLII